MAEIRRPDRELVGIFNAAEWETLTVTADRNKAIRAAVAAVEAAVRERIAREIEAAAPKVMTSPGSTARAEVTAFARAARIARDGEDDG